MPTNMLLGQVLRENKKLHQESPGISFFIQFPIFF